MVEPCVEHGVGLVVPTIDTELPVLAAARAASPPSGRRWPCRRPDVVAIAADKRRRTSGWRARVPHRPPGAPATAADRRLAVPARRQAAVRQRRARRRGRRRHGRARRRRATRRRRRRDVAARRRVHDRRPRRPGGRVRLRRAAPADRGARRRGGQGRHGAFGGARARSPSTSCAALPGPFGALTIQVFVDDDRASWRSSSSTPASAAASRCRARRAPTSRGGCSRTCSACPSTAAADGWRDGLVMLRYDAAVFVATPGHG